MYGAGGWRGHWGVDVGVGIGEMQLQRRLDARLVLGFGLTAVERHRRVQIRQPRGEQIRDAAAVAAWRLLLIFPVGIVLS